MAKECVICRNKIGIFSGRVECLDGFICVNCFEKMGFSYEHYKIWKSLLDFKNKSVHELYNINNVPVNILNIAENPKLSTKEKISQLIVNDSSINLKKNEFCLFSSEAYIGKQRSKTILSMSRGLYSSTPVAFGMKMRSSSTRRESIKESYWEKTPCSFFVTNNRFIALAIKNGFEFNKSKLIRTEMHDGSEFYNGSLFGMELYSNDDCLVFYTSTSTRFIFMNEGNIKRYQILYELLNRADTEGLKASDFIK